MPPLSVTKRDLKNIPTITTASADAVITVVTGTVASRAVAINTKELKERSRTKVLHTQEKLETIVTEVTFITDDDNQRKKNKDV